jgi:hypothetical protein
MNVDRKLILAGLAGLTLILAGAAAVVFLGGRDAKDDPNSQNLVALGEAALALRLTVLESGIAAIEASQIREYNLPVGTFSSESIQITRDGQPVPVHVTGQGRDTIFYFYAEAITDTLAAPAVYWLSPGRGTVMRQTRAAPESPAARVGWQHRRWESNETFLAQSTGDDVWLGKLLFAPSSLDIPLEGIQPSGGPGELTVRIWSNNQARENPDHHVELILNGEMVADHYWDGIKQETISVTLPAGTLLANGNVLTINAPGDTGAAGEALYIDWVTLDYEGHLTTNNNHLWFKSDSDNLEVTGTTEDDLVFDISQPSQPKVLVDVVQDGRNLSFAGQGSDRTYFVFAAQHALEPQISAVPIREPLTGVGLGADYLAIVADEDGFLETLQPLLEYRQQSGMQTVAVPVSQVFDEFGHGRQTTESIRAFLAYTAASWDPAPRYVLLVGDANYDIYNFTGGRNPNLLPTHLVFTEFAGYVASDTWFTIFEDDALAPEMAIGRLPAQNIGQLEIMVNKTLDYENDAASDTEWVGRALLVADDEPDFDKVSDDLASELSRIGYSTQKLYMTDNADIHQPLVSALNQGVGIINYVGHGSIEVWGDERVFATEDASILINGSRLPIFTTFTCLNGYFNHPEVDALAETLLWAKDGGVVAAIAPSGRSLTSQQLPLAEVFYRALLNGEVATLGEALQLAKVAGADDKGLKDVIHTFNLLGDPALLFKLP